MTHRTFRAMSIALSALVVTSACGDKSADQSSARDVTLSPPPPPATQTDLRDVPPATGAKTAPASESRPRSTTSSKTATSKSAPTTTAAAPQAAPPVAPPAAAPASAPVGAKMGVIASGTSFALQTTQRVCTPTAKAGDKFTATVTDAIPGSNGASIPAGAVATVEIVDARPGINNADSVKMTFRVTSISYSGQTYAVDGGDVVQAQVDRVRRQSTGTQAKKVATGAAIGAVVGRILGHNTKSTVIGGAVGAAGGAAVAAGTADYDGCVASDSRLAVKLSQPLKIRVSTD